MNCLFNKVIVICLEHPFHGDVDSQLRVPQDGVVGRVRGLDGQESRDGRRPRLRRVRRAQPAARRLRRVAHAHAHVSIGNKTSRLLHIFMIKLLLL